MNKNKIIELISIPVDVISEDEVLDDMFCNIHKYANDLEFYNWLINSACYSDRTDHINNVINAQVQANFVADMIDNYQNGPEMFEDAIAYYGVEQYKDKIISLVKEIIK